MNKIISYKSAEVICNNLRNENKSIIFKSGCFDIIHIGHILMLQEAKKIADVLIVGVGSNETVLKERPFTFFDENNRAATIASLSCVDYVVIEREINYGNIDHSTLLNILKPDYFSISTDDKQYDVKSMLSSVIGSKIIPQEQVTVLNYGKLIQPHASDIKKSIK
jgi:cytidyltransferase-like protein